MTIEVRHLKSRLSAERLQSIKELIASRLQADPLLMDARARLLGGASRKPKKGGK